MLDTFIIPKPNNHEVITIAYSKWAYYISKLNNKIESGIINNQLDDPIFIPLCLTLTYREILAYISKRLKYKKIDKGCFILLILIGGFLRNELDPNIQPFSEYYSKDIKLLDPDELSEKFTSYLNYLREELKNVTPLV